MLSSLGNADMVGNSYVVYVGNDDTITVTNLQSNRRYHFAVYEYAIGYDYANISQVKRGTALTTLDYVALKLQGRE